MPRPEPIAGRCHALGECNGVNPEPLTIYSLSFVSRDDSDNSFLVYCCYIKYFS